MSRAYVIERELQWLIAIYLVVLSTIIVLTNHGDIVLWINARHTVQGDFFFKYWTYLGDGILLGAIALYFLFTNMFRFYFMLVAIALQTAFVHIFKQWLYAGDPRPKTFFADSIDQLNFVEGVTVRGYDSFPSGHTATAFAMAMVLIYISKNMYLRFLLFVSAILVGVSRIYILQHFGRDVFFGSLFGILSVVLAWQILRKQAWNTKLERGLIKR